MFVSLSRLSLSPLGSTHVLGQPTFPNENHESSSKRGAKGRSKTGQKAPSLATRTTRAPRARALSRSRALALTAQSRVGVVSDTRPMHRHTRGQRATCHQTPPAHAPKLTQICALSLRACHSAAYRRGSVGFVVDSCLRSRRASAEGCATSKWSRAAGQSASAASR